jgi:hypothetical protein
VRTKIAIELIDLQDITNIANEKRTDIEVGAEAEVVVETGGANDTATDRGMDDDAITTNAETDTWSTRTRGAKRGTGQETAMTGVTRDRGDIRKTAHEVHFEASAAEATAFAQGRLAVAEIRVETSVELNPRTHKRATYISEPCRVVIKPSSASWSAKPGPE